ncbi:hypothetical protein ACKXGD_17500, partial [Enterococcus lactis]|uniref:hypothetical protein n=1 Tax=Enterococcus lactis TaxID=357441 RepID=UPI003907FD0C
EAHMFKHCWPFPKQDIIAREFPDQPISDRVYNHAKKFYEDSIDLESQKFLELMRAKNHEAEEKFANLLMRQAVHVALGHMRHSD